MNVVRERENTVVFGLFSTALLMCREVVAQNWGAGGEFWSNFMNSQVRFPEL